MPLDTFIRQTDGGATTTKTISPPTPIESEMQSRGLSHDGTLGPQRNYTLKPVVPVADVNVTRPLDTAETKQTEPLVREPVPWTPQPLERATQLSTLAQDKASGTPQVLPKEKPPGLGDPDFLGGGGGGGGTTSNGGLGGGTATGNKLDPWTILNNIMTDSFEYNPFDDPEYLQAAAELENQIVQQMVGRGGLYSSIARDSVQRGMVNLQNTFRQNAYDKWQNNRSMMLDIAQFASTLQERDYDRWYKQQQLSIQQNRDNADRKYASALQNKSKYDAMVERWMSAEGQLADEQVALYFGINQSVPFSAGVLARRQKETSVMNALNAAESYMQKSGSVEMNLKIADLYREQSLSGKAEQEDPLAGVTIEDVEKATPEKIAWAQFGRGTPQAQEVLASYLRLLSPFAGAKTKAQADAALNSIVSATSMAMLEPYLGPHLTTKIALEAYTKYADSLERIAKYESDVAAGKAEPITTTPTSGR